MARRLGHVTHLPAALRQRVLDGIFDDGAVGVELCPTSNMVTKEISSTELGSLLRDATLGALRSRRSSLPGLVAQVGQGLAKPGNIDRGLLNVGRGVNTDDVGHLALEDVHRRVVFQAYSPVTCPLRSST